MKNVILIALGAVAVGGLVLTVGGAAPQIEPGEKAPVIDMASSTGKKFSNAQVQKEGGYMLLFLGVDCPATPQAEPYFASMVKAYGKKNRLFVVMDTDKKGFDAWQKKYKSPFTVVLDDKKATIRAYDVASGPTVVSVTKDGKVDKVWAGYSQKIYTEINAGLAGLAGEKPAELDLSKAPKNTRFG
jgi:peroxiredoxin